MRKKTNSEYGHSHKEVGSLCYKQKAASATVLSSKNSVKTLQIELTLNSSSCQLCEER